MTKRFLQIHTLTGYSAALLNRDDIGRAKRMTLGGYDRLRISSQCLKRHWRSATSEWSIADLAEGKSLRSRKIFSDVIAKDLVQEGMNPKDITQVLKPVKDMVLTGKLNKSSTSSKKKPQDDLVQEDGKFETLRTDQVIVLGQPEISFLRNLALELHRNTQDKGTDIQEEVKSYFEGKEGKNTRENLKSLVRGAGVDAAIFGRMVTSDVLARTDAAIHVAHSFTVHAEESEPDYFSALDDLILESGELGSGHINSTEITSGLFYSYVVIDVPLLIQNLTKDVELAEEVVKRIIHLIATITPGAKLGATAPYACAEFMMIESGNTQPRTIANAFASPVSKQDARSGAVQELNRYLERYDNMYGCEDTRKFASMIEVPSTNHTGDKVPLGLLAQWAASTVAGN